MMSIFNSFSVLTCQNIFINIIDKQCVKLSQGIQENREVVPLVKCLPCNVKTCVQISSILIKKLSVAAYVATPV